MPSRRLRVNLSAYSLKRAIVAPRTVLRRRRARGEEGYGRSMLEAQYYRPAMYDFIGATIVDPDLLVDADLDERSVVVDAGAYVGEWSERIAQRYGCRIYAVEPVPSAFSRASEVLSPYDVVLLQIALGGRNDDAEISIDGPGSALGAGAGAFGTADVTVRDVTEVFAELGLDHIDLLKINIEGGEYDVLDRLDETQWLPRIGMVSVQFHEWHPKAYYRRWRIRRRLRRTHEQVWSYPWVWELWRRR